jgi:uncharacterized membrane protein
MAALPERTRYHRVMGWHAPALRRTAISATPGLVVGIAFLWFVPWPVSVIAGWDTSSAIFVVTVWSMILRVDGAGTEDLSMREDETRGTATLLLIGASVVSLLAVGFCLGLAGKESGGLRVLLIGLATLTVLLSWLVVNTVFTLRYAHLYFSAPAGVIDFGEGADGPRPNYRDFAYLAFTIGMTYQVSDTQLRNQTFRHTVLLHAMLSYAFGVVIVAAGINLIAGLVA